MQFAEFGGHTEEVPLVAVRQSSDAIDGDDDDADGGSGACAMCHRVQNLSVVSRPPIRPGALTPALLLSPSLPSTRHHLIPRTMHAKYLQKGTPRARLNETVAICRACHNVVHHTASEARLAAELNTLEALLTVEAVQKWLAFAGKTGRQTKWDHHVNTARAGRGARP